ncbi:MAG: PQQ-binding-like beta-propeller repeat protein [Anaerolineales bacterium]|jgi:outer membrane protein assembly factor BamB
MKIKSVLLIAAFLVLSLLLAGCASGLTASSWASAVADANDAYLAGGSYVYAVSLSNGTQVWHYPAKASANPFYALPALTSDGQVIVGGFDHNLYSLSQKDGTQNWVFNQAHDRWYGGVLVSGDTIYAPNADYNLYALDLHGNLKWTFQADQSLWAAPVSDGQRVYFGTLGRKVYAVDAHTGKQVWVQSVNGAILGSPVLQSDGTLFVGTYGGSVVALDTSTGRVRWSHPASGWIWASPTLTDTDLLVGDSKGMLYDLDPSTGKERWHQQLNGSILSSPASDGKSIVVGTEDGNLYYYDLTGSVVHTASVSGKVYSTPVIIGNTILVVPTGATDILIAYDQNGTQKWALPPAK